MRSFGGEGSVCELDQHHPVVCGAKPCDGLTYRALRKLSLDDKVFFALP